MWWYMENKAYFTAKAPEPVGPYSQAIEAGGFLFLSGQVPLMKSGEMLDDSAAAQTQKVMSHIQAVLKSAGLNCEHIVKVTVFLTNLDDFAAVNKIYAAFFKDVPPARSCVEVSALPKGAKVEIEAIAKFP